jgi:glucokinase
MKKIQRAGIGVDFGGTYVKMALVSEEGEILSRCKHSTKDIETVDAWMDAVALGIPELLKGSGVRQEFIAGLGVGVPGFVDYNRGYIYELPNVKGWKDVYLSRILRKRFGLPVFVDNDVNVMAQGESMYGAGQDYQDAVFITLGTGVGGGIVIDRKLYRGAFSMAGEVGHLSIDRNGVTSPQGRGGLEQYVGNRRIIERTVKALKKGRKSLITELVEGNLDEVTPKVIAKAAGKGDELAIEIFDFMADCLATAFASVTYLLQPEVFIVGGGVSQSGKVLFDPLKKHLKDRLSPFFAERIEIVRAKLGNDAGVIGAAGLTLAGR